jgi:hypothetical protein
MLKNTSRILNLLANSCDGTIIAKVKHGRTKENQNKNMKAFKILFLAIGVALAFAGANAKADLTLNVSGTAQVQGTNGAFKGVINSYSFSEKTVYGIISNGVANAATTNFTSYATNLMSVTTNLPADGYIAFAPSASDGLVTGRFYVTNSAGFYFPLSGYVTNTVRATNHIVNYYSFVELDTTLTRGDTNDVSTNNWGFYYFALFFPPTPVFDGISSYSLSDKTGSGSDMSVSKAVLYIHDNALAYGDPPNDSNSYYNPESFPFYPLAYNDNAIEVDGILTAKLTITTNNVTGGTLSLPGTGNFRYQGVNHGVVSNGKATLTVVK